MQTISVGGAITFWTLPENTDRVGLASRLETIDVALAKYAPRPRTWNACLRDALEDMFTKSIIRPLDKDEGWAVLSETRLRDEVQLVTTHAFAVDDDGNIDFRKGYGSYFAQDIEESVKRFRQIVKPAQVAACLVQVINHLYGTPLRSHGGIYWMPDKALGVWDQVRAAVHESAVRGRAYVYKVTHSFDNDSLRAVRDAITAEATREAEEIMRDVDSGKLGERALRARAKEAERLIEKVKDYENILGQSLSVVRSIVEDVEIAATAAKITASSAPAV